MIDVLKRTLPLVLYFGLIFSASAQVCREPGSTQPAPKGTSFIDCDHKQRDTVITCENNAPAGQQINEGTRGACPPKPAAALQTPRKSLVSDYSPYLYAFPRNPDNEDEDEAYNGSITTGTGSGPDKVFSEFIQHEGDVKRSAGCIPQIKAPRRPRSPEEEAKLVRLQLDNCTNQYILQGALHPFQDSNSRQINNPSDPLGPSLGTTLETECQPLKINLDAFMENEYNVDEYIQEAWIKSLQDPTHRRARAFTVPTVVSKGLKLAGINLPNLIVNQSEPGLPKNLKLLNPIAPPNPMPEILPSHIAATPYEKIFDPTHPFSPRWDFVGTERELYSPLTREYMTKTDNAVFCAGVREAPNEKDKKKKADLEVPVDVLRFREAKFTGGITRRIGYNTLCKKDKRGEWERFFSAFPVPDPLGPIKSYCFQFNKADVAKAIGICVVTLGSKCVDEFNQVKARKLACWDDCFRIRADKVDDERNFPPCATRIRGRDQKMRGYAGLPDLKNLQLKDVVDIIKGATSLRFAGALNVFSKTAQCGFPGEPRNANRDIEKLCSDLRRPYTQINRLKMRYHNPDDKDNIVLTNGVPEGLTFKEYFGNHMPYPKIWDTSTSLNKSGSSSNEQSPEDTTGQYTAIVGVGREGAPKSAGDEAQKKHKDERCLFGGWGNGGGLLGAGVGAVSNQVGLSLGVPAKFAGLTINTPDPITSWTELKVYQMRTMRNANMTCLGKYEKVFKSGSSENLILMITGGEWSRVVVQKCPKKPDQRGRIICSFMSYSEYLKAGSPRNTPFSSFKLIPQTKLENWPNSWRGYMAPGTDTPIVPNLNRFPNFGSVAPPVPNFGAAQPFVDPITFKGLSNAQLGDIIVMPMGASNINGPVTLLAKDKPGLAKIALVTEVNLPNPNKKPGERDCRDRRDCFVQVMEADNGKWPDSCGTTSNWGQLKTRFYYQPGFLPHSVKTEMDRIGATNSCEDTSLGRCEFLPWDNITLYRIRNDLRPGCLKPSVKDC